MNSTTRPGDKASADGILPWLLGAVLVLGCLVIYRRVGTFDFVAFDDDYNLLFNPHLGPLSLERVHWAFSDWQYARRCMPLGWLGFSAIFSLSGLNPAGYHLAGLGLHATNTLLFFVLLRRFAEASLPPGVETSRHWSAACAFLGAMFWAWHPLRVETVAWSSGLLYGQAEFFLLLALVMFVRSPAAPAARLGALVAYGLSLLSYPLAIGFAPVFALVAAWRLKGGWRGLWIALPFVLLAAGATAVNLVARVDADGAFVRVPTLAEFSLAARAMQAAYAWVYYAWVPFWPVGLTPANPVLMNFDPWSAPFVISAAGWVVVTVACVAWPVARRTLGPFWLAHLCVLAPLIGWVEHPYFPCDRYAAFPQAVLAVGLVMGLVRLQPASARTLALAAGFAAGGVMGILSARQTEIWRDTPALFQRISSGLRPAASPLMYFQRPALVRFRNGDISGALALLNEGIVLLPKNRTLRLERSDLQRQESALQALLISMGAPPATPLAVLMQQELGLAAARDGDLMAAQEHLRLALAGAPDFYAPAYNRALVSLRQGQTRAALDYYLWAEAHGGKHLSFRARQAALGLIADQFAASGDPRLAAAARARSLKVRRD
jgi:hypothetical protein